MKPDIFDSVPLFFKIATNKLKTAKTLKIIVSE